MNYHQLKILNLPEPPSEERFVRQVALVHCLARRWAQAADASGLEALLLPDDRRALRVLIAEACGRSLLSPEACAAVRACAETCTARIADLVDQDAPASRSAALVLHDRAEELRDLVGHIDEVLDLRAALEMWRRIRLDESGQLSPS